ncbi:MAG: hypothetical protein R2867_16835 [Caldilineaceae bacterium]
MKHLPFSSFMASARLETATLDQAAGRVGQRRRRWAILLLQPVALVALLLWLTGGAVQPVHAQSCPIFPDPQARFGFNVARDGGRTIDNYNVQPLNGHWYLDYATQVTPSRPAAMAYAQMIRAQCVGTALARRPRYAALAEKPGHVVDHRQRTGPA